jgi:hypothetical protein
MLQALALGHVESLAAARHIIRNSSQIRRFEPQDPEAWTHAFTRFESLLNDVAHPAQRDQSASLKPSPKDGDK